MAGSSTTAGTRAAGDARESDERIEAKLDALLRDRNLDPQNP